MIHIQRERDTLSINEDLGAGGVDVETSFTKILRNLDLTDSEFINSTDSDGSELRYELVSIVNHHGPIPDVGHYTTFGKRKDPETGLRDWYIFNDEDVVKLSETSNPDIGMVLKSAESVLLFYAR